MPELPEVETIRLQLNQALVGLKIANIEVLSPKNFVGSVDEVVGRKVVGVERRGKVLIMRLGDGLDRKRGSLRALKDIEGTERFLAVHLKLTGQLIYREAGSEKREVRFTQNSGPFAVGELPNKYTRVIVSFANGSRLYFNDLRKFGWIKLVNSNQLSVMSKELGIEPFDKEFTVEYLQKVFSKTSRAIKLVLLDQQKIAGIGNIYANEALFLAGIDPRRPAKSLVEKEIKSRPPTSGRGRGSSAEPGKLRKAIIKVLKDSITHKGTSDRDEAYRQISGEKGKHQNYLKVYGREGEKCPACGGKIERVKIGGRGTFYCPKCQR